MSDEFKKARCLLVFKVVRNIDEPVNVAHIAKKTSIIVNTDLILNRVNTLNLHVMFLNVSRVDDLMLSDDNV